MPQLAEPDEPAGEPHVLQIRIVADNYATHKTPAVQEWLAKHRRLHIHFTPTSSSWLNQIERWFGLLTEKLLRRGVRKSAKQLEKDILAWVDTWNEDPKPFIWTKSAEEILESLGRLCGASKIQDTSTSDSTRRLEVRTDRGLLRGKQHASRTGGCAGLNDHSGLPARCNHESSSSGHPHIATGTPAVSVRHVASLHSPRSFSSARLPCRTADHDCSL